MRSIRLSDASFANNLIGKYGWSIGRSANRRSSMIYRMEQKLQQFSSTPLHIDVHIRQIRSILNMYSLNASRASERQQLIEGRVIEGRMMRVANVNASVKAVGGLKAIQQQGKSNLLNTIIVREHSIGRSEQLMSNQSQHPDFIEAFHPSSLKQARVMRNDLALTLNQVNHWIQNQTWRSQTVMQRPISPEPIVNHSLSLTTKEYMQSTHSHLHQIRVNGESSETLVIINRKLPSMQLSMQRSRLAVEQIRHLFAVMPQTGVDPQRDQEILRQTATEQRKLNEVSYRSQIASRQMIRVTQSLDNQRPELKEGHEQQVGQQRVKTTPLNVQPSIQQLVERIIGQAAKQRVQPSTQQPIQLQRMIQQLMAATTQSVSVILPGIVTNRYFDHSVQRHIQQNRDRDSVMPHKLVYTISRPLGMNADKGNPVISSVREIIRQEKARIIQQSDTVIQPLGAKLLRAASHIRHENNRQVELRTELQTGPQVSRNTIVQAQFHLIERIMRHVQLDQQKWNVDSPLQLSNKAIERNRIQSRTDILNNKIMKVSRLTTSNSLLHHNHTINQSQDMLHSRTVNRSEEQRQTVQVHVSQHHVEQDQTTQSQTQLQSQAPDHRSTQMNNKVPHSPQHQLNKEITIEQHVTELNVRTQNRTQINRTSLQFDRQLVSRLSKHGNHVIMNRLRPIRLERLTNVRRTMIPRSQAELQSRIVNRSQEQRQTANVHLSPRNVEQAQAMLSQAPGQQSMQKDNKAPRSPQHQVSEENIIEQHITEQNVRIQHRTQINRTSLQLDRQLVSRLSKHENEVVLNQLKPVQLERLTSVRRTMSRSQQRTVMMINQMDKAQSMKLKSNLVIARTHLRELPDEGQAAAGSLTGISAARSGAGLQGSAMPLIVASGQAGRQSTGSPLPVVIRGQGNQQAVSLDVPIKKTAQPNHDEPVIRSLEYAIKTIEQDLNQAKEEWAQPKLDMKRLTDQVYKEFSKRMRHEQQRRGI